MSELEERVVTDPNLNGLRIDQFYEDARARAESAETLLATTIQGLVLLNSAGFAALTGLLASSHSPTSAFRLAAEPLKRPHRCSFRARWRGNRGRLLRYVQQ